MAAVLFLCAFSGCAPRPPAAVHEVQFFAFGTLVELSIVTPEAGVAKEAEGQVRSLFDTLHRELYPWAPGALAGTNGALEGGRPAAAASWLRALIRRAQALSERSGGRFNPAIGRLVELWGFHRDEPRAAPPAAERIAALVAAAPNMEDLSFVGDTLQGRNPALMLDLGAYAKGYAVDRAIARLKRLGAVGGLVNAGGDLRAFGARGARPWRIGIRHPRGPGVIAALEIDGAEAVSTSGDYERFFMHRGRRYHHILDPKSGYPAAGAIAATVVHRRGAVADAAATALVVAGRREWREVARRLGIDKAMLIDAEGFIHLTPELRARLQFQVEPARSLLEASS